ncbi:MAG: hypothetical protein MSH60_01065 [Ruminococcus sp.]|nr:hypothetical protein [Ruminococcus sp.]
MILNISDPEKAKKTLTDKGVSAENADALIKTAQHIFETEFDTDRKDDDNEEPELFV